MSLPPSPFGQSLFGGPNGQQQSQQPQQQMQNPFMQSSGGGFGDFIQTGQFGSQPVPRGGGFGGGFGQQQMPAYAQGYMNNMGGFGGNQGFGGGFNPMQGGYGGGFGGGFNPMQGGYGGQMQNPFMGGMGGFGGGYSPYQMQNPFMGGMGGFGGGYGPPQRGFGGGYGSQALLPSFGRGNMGSMGSDMMQYASPQMQNAAMNQPLRQQYDTMMAQSQFMPGTAPPTFEEYSQRADKANRGGYGGQNQTPAFAQSYMGNMGQMASQQADIAAQRKYAQPGQDYRTVSPQQISQMQNQQRAFFQDPEFQGYRQQADDLSKQMNEYMQKAPMYQQLQDLQGKMQGVQGRYASNPYAGSMGPGAVDLTQQRAQPAVMPRNPIQQLGGVGGLATLLGGHSRLLQERPTPFPNQVQPAQATIPPPGMEMRKGPGGSYYVPTGTPYNPAMG